MSLCARAWHDWAMAIGLFDHINLNIDIILICLLLSSMSRRQVSPIRAPPASDPRDAMIRKLKEDIIVARGREKELAILESYLLELTEKTKLLAAETAKADEEGKLKLELTLKTINELKKDVDLLRGEMRSTTNELTAVTEEEAQFKRNLNSKVFEIEKLKKEGVSLHEENQKLLAEAYRLRAQEDETLHEIKKLTQTIRNYEGRVSEINRKVAEVKAYIAAVSQENALLKEKLRGYEHQNTGIGNDLDQKENHIDILEKTFADKHEQIKGQVENYIEIEYLNQKNLKQTKHKANLAKIENQKYNELNAVIKKVEKTIADRSKELSQVKADSGEILRINEDFADKNTRLKKDLLYCQEHLQNLLKHNAYIQEEMENYVREDDAIISVIRRKRVIPLNNYNSLRTSRNEGKASTRTYQ